MSSQSTSGTKYDTCVIDLDTGEVLWDGKGRAKADFTVFFQDMDIDYLSDVKVVAMVMTQHFVIDDQG